MSSKRLKILVVFLFVLSVANLFFGVSFARRQISHRLVWERGEYSALLEKLMYDMQRMYVDEIPAEELFRGALRGMVSALGDVNSAFFDPSAFKQLREDTRGHFGGLGITIGIRDGFLTIISVMEGNPAHRAGIEAGERIFSIDGVPTVGISPEQAVDKLRAGADHAMIREMLGISLPEAVSRLRGPVGEPVTVSVGETEESARKIEIVRAKIDMETVVNPVVLEEGIGYLHVRNFGQGTPAAVDEAVKRLENQGIESLIIDLRNNPGGLLSSAVSVADKFVPEGEVIVSVKGRDSGEESERILSRRPRSYDMPLIILVNEHSASGAEIVAAALQDLGRAIIIGGRTYGKGSVQSIIDLPDGSGIKLTVSRYYSPSGKVIDNKGVLPDITAELAEGEKLQDLGAGEVKIDSQLRQALNLLKFHGMLRNIRI